MPQPLQTPSPQLASSQFQAPWSEFETASFPSHSPTPPTPPVADVVAPPSLLAFVLKTCGAKHTFISNLNESSIKTLQSFRQDTGM